MQTDSMQTDSMWTDSMQTDSMQADSMQTLFVGRLYVDRLYVDGLCRPSVLSQITCRKNSYLPENGRQEIQENQRTLFKKTNQYGEKTKHPDISSKTQWHILTTAKEENARIHVNKYLQTAGMGNKWSMIQMEYDTNGV